MRTRKLSTRRKASPICKEFGAKVRYLREKKKWSQEELAHVSGIHVTYLSGLERGHRNPTLNVISHLAAAFGITTSELLRSVSEASE
ncbi:MAG: helix-turn-helix transcriptional regulator [Nitrospirota bacterium]